MLYPHFFKYQQSGNDFIIFDGTTANFSQLEIQKLCHRKFGVGADGLILFKKINRNTFQMQIFNSDGNEAESCGNGICCLAKYFKDQNLIETDLITLKLLDSTVKIFYKNEQIKVRLDEPFDVKLNQNFDKDLKYHLVNTGVPHFVTFINDIENVNLSKLGPFIRYHRDFMPYGVNVNFASVKNENLIMVRTYERGVEAETLSCGTGACAVALIASFVYNLSSPIKICHPGGTLEVDFQRNQSNFQNLSIIGSPQKIYSGQLSMNYNSGDLVC
jgi:diaminopimelate epimerase